MAVKNEEIKSLLAIKAHLTLHSYFFLRGGGGVVNYAGKSNFTLPKENATLRGSSAANNSRV